MFLPCPTLENSASEYSGIELRTFEDFALDTFLLVGREDIAQCYKMFTLWSIFFNSNKTHFEAKFVIRKEF
jgi:hypothetical protein